MKMNIMIDGKEMTIDIKKAKELGLLNEKVDRLEPCRDLYSGYYWVVASHGKSVEYYDEQDTIDDLHFEKSNCFRTKEQAELMSKYTFDIWFKIRAWVITEGVLKEFVEGEKNYYIYYNYVDELWCYGCYIHMQVGHIYFKDKESALRLVKILNNGNYRP